MKRIGTKSGKKKQSWAISRSGTGTKTERYRYQNREVSVPPIRSQSVLVSIQEVPVPPNRMQSVPVPVRAVPVTQCLKCPDLCVFV